MCKINIAAYDRRILPYRKRASVTSCFHGFGLSFNYAYKLRRIASIGGNETQFMLDMAGVMRRNNTYIGGARLSDGKTEKARPQNTGAQTHGYPELAPRLDFRCLVQRESLLRPQGSSPGPLRNAAPTRRGRNLDCRCGYPFRCFAPHLLPDAGRIPPGRLKRTASKAPWAQGRAQAVQQRYRICAEPAGHRAKLDDRRLYQSGSGKVWSLSSPAQSGAGVVEQKKTAQTGVDSAIPEEAVNAYEGLRRQAVQPDGRVGQLEGCGVLMRCGLAAWAQLRRSTVLTRPPEPLCKLPAFASPGAELIRLVASLILNTRQENFLHA
jgi:hypothetical protein